MSKTTTTKTIQISVHLSIGYANSNREAVLDVEVDENASEEEIEEACQAEFDVWLSNHMDSGWSINH